MLKEFSVELQVVWNKLTLCVYHYETRRCEMAGFDGDEGGGGVHVASRRRAVKRSMNRLRARDVNTYLRDNPARMAVHSRSKYGIFRAFYFTNKK